MIDANVYLVQVFGEGIEELVFDNIVGIFISKAKARLYIKREQKRFEGSGIPMDFSIFAFRLNSDDSPLLVYTTKKNELNSTDTPTTAVDPYE
jgi:hypothetical protein